MAEKCCHSRHCCSEIYLGLTPSNLAPRYYLEEMTERRRIIWNLWFWPERPIMCIGMPLKMFHLIGFGWFIMALMILSNSHIIILFWVAGVRPGSRGTFVSAKVPKTIDAQSGLLRGDGRKTQECEPTRCAQTRLAGS